MHEIKNLLIPVLFVLSLGFLTIGFVRGYRRSRRRTARAEGKVLGVRWESGGKGGKVAVPEIEFPDSRGQRIKFQSRLRSSWNPWPAGSRVQVFYDPEHPTNAEIKPTRGMVLFVVGFLSVLIVGFGTSRFRQYPRGYLWSAFSQFEMVAASMAIACGYEDAIAHDRIRHDPLMKAAVGRHPETGPPLASQSTISRLEERAEQDRSSAARGGPSRSVRLDREAGQE
jgi:hypothetical protein